MRFPIQIKDITFGKQRRDSNGNFHISIFVQDQEVGWITKQTHFFEDENEFYDDDKYKTRCVGYQAYGYGWYQDGDQVTLNNFFRFSEKMIAVGNTAYLNEMGKSEYDNRIGSWCTEHHPTARKALSATRKLVKEHLVRATHLVKVSQLWQEVRAGCSRVAYNR